MREPSITICPECHGLQAVIYQVEMGSSQAEVRDPPVAFDPNRPLYAQVHLCHCASPRDTPGAYYEHLQWLARRSNIANMDRLIRDTADLLSLDIERASHFMYNMLLLAHPNDPLFQRPRRSEMGEEQDEQQ